jgi:hypothetical protein
MRIIWRRKRYKLGLQEFIEFLVTCLVERTVKILLFVTVPAIKENGKMEV